MRGTTDIVIPHMTRGIMLSITCRVNLGIAVHVIPPLTPVATCPAPDQSTVYSLWSTAPEMTSRTAGPTMAKITFRTKDQTTVQTTS
jgi:hypothetical protein